MSSKDISRSTSSKAGASPPTAPSSPTRMATSTSTAGTPQPTERHGGTVQGHPGVGQVAHDGVGQSEVLLNRRRVEADLPTHRAPRRPPVRHPDGPAWRACRATRRQLCSRRPPGESRAGSGQGPTGRSVSWTPRCSRHRRRCRHHRRNRHRRSRRGLRLGRSRRHRRSRHHRRRGRVLRLGAHGAGARRRPRPRRTEGSSGRATWWNGLPRGAGSPRSRGYARRGRILGRESRRRRSPPRIGPQTSLGPTDHRVAWRIVGVSARRSKESQSCRCGS